jgi:hypothetical protein
VHPRDCPEQAFLKNATFGGIFGQGFPQTTAYSEILSNLKAEEYALCLAKALRFSGDTKDET